MLAQQMPFAAVARIVGESAHRVMAVCERYVEIALGLADFSQVTALAIDETSRARGHDYATLAADAAARRVLFVTEGRDAKTLQALAADLAAHGCPAEQITSVSIDMSPAFIRAALSSCPTPASPSTSSTLSGMPVRRWTRCAASSSAATSRSRVCAGRC